MSTFTLAISFDHFQFVLIHGPNIPGSYAILFFTASDLASINSHIHNWVGAQYASGDQWRNNSERTFKTYPHLPNMNLDKSRGKYFLNVQTYSVALYL